MVENCGRILEILRFAQYDKVLQEQNSAPIHSPSLCAFAVQNIISVVLKRRFVYFLGVNCEFVLLKNCKISCFFILLW